MSAAGHLDELQVQRLEEMCIVIDENDRILGAETKKNCHLRENIDKGLLHRGFSVLIFNTDDELLVQQRSDAKYTFPGHFSDSCSSHPLFTPEECEDKDKLGVRRAALRRLLAELGIPPDQICLQDIIFMTIYHHSPSDEVWGDHEVGYLLLVRKNLTVKPDPREVKSYHYMSREKLAELLNRATRGQERVTPWFRTIVEGFLFRWWEHLKDVSQFVEPDTIHRPEGTRSPGSPQWRVEELCFEGQGL
ncbi:LOW QUALITY PROTEIN: isopentenyl-diphosphate delta-isomerase 2-like [Suncus etruscus]|uniref:LOW QUALITY PROTEIN: isopentenyl-diphosphate delta-isomerase 2-like n=1 Tax=Suncus etruscus TaxID=109475 RepID=UPI00210FE1BD|nr:LOW QUALITY PROTEIN: isopentenyl-diphosphate delta-isomerase 2-like [Suncus etruscus]